MEVKQHKFSEAPYKTTLRLEAKIARELRTLASSRKESINQVLNSVIKSGLNSERKTAT